MLNRFNLLFIILLEEGVLQSERIVDFILSEEHLARSCHFVTLHIEGGISQLKVLVFLSQQIRDYPQLRILSELSRIHGQRLVFLGARIAIHEGS